MEQADKKNSIENVNSNNKDMFHSLFENSLNAMLLGIPDGTLLEANAAALDMFGYSLEEIRAIGRAAIFDHADANMVAALKKRQIDGKAKGELIGIRKNGERFPCEFSSAIFKIETGELRTSTVLIDISDRKKTENEMALLINNTEESFILLDKNLCIVSFNKQFKERYKSLLNKDVVKGDAILDYAQPNRKNIVENIYERVLKGETIEDEIEVSAKDEGTYTFASTYKPAFDNEGHIIGAFVTTRDITEKKKAQELVISNEKRFRSIIEHTGDLITLTNEDGNIIYMSPSLEKVVGYSEEDIINKSYKIVIHPDHKKESELVFNELLAKPGIPINRVTRILHKKGHYVWVEGVVTNLLHDENVKAIVSNYRDISEKIGINQEKEYERRDKEALINSTDDLIWSVSKDFKLIAGNNAFLNSLKTYTGVSLKQGDDLLLNKYFTKDFISFWEEMYKKALLGESFKKEVFSPEQENVAQIWTETSFNPIYHENEIIGIACYARDITERKLSDEKLRVSKERYDIIAKATNDTIWDWDLVSNKIKWNKGIIGVFGYYQDESDMNIDWWFSKIHSDDVDRIKKNIESRINKKEPRWEDEYRFCCADGTYKYVNDRGFLVVNNSVPVRIIGAMQDITRHKEEEHHLKLLESVITHTNDAIMITEAEPFDEPGPRILYVNEAFTKMTGYSSEEVVGKSPRILQGPKTDKKELKRLSESIRKWKPCEVTIINYKKNGEEFWINFSLSPVANEKGWFTHWISVERDVTRRKQDEMERDQIIAELSQNNLDLKQFSYVTSHNLRAPIANLLGLSNLIDYYPVSDESLKKVLDGIKQSAIMFDETVKDLSKVLIIKDQINITLEEFSLISMINKTLTQLSIMVDNNDVEINYDLKIPQVIFTASFLESIFINLFTNALKYKSNKHKLIIDISSDSVDDYTVVKFKDNGIGIDLEKHSDKIFKLYQRFHDNSDGKGLGLYLVKSQMEALGGTIDVESEVGKGTTFILKFKKNPEK